MTQTVPVARGCPRCGGWFTRRMLHAEEVSHTAYHCVPCGEDIRIEDGVPVSDTRPTSTLTDADLRRERHAQAVEATVVRRRGSEVTQ